MPFLKKGIYVMIFMERWNYIWQKNLLWKFISLLSFARGLFAFKSIPNIVNISPVV